MRWCITYVRIPGSNAQMSRAIQHYVNMSTCQPAFSQYVHLPASILPVCPLASQHSVSQPAFSQHSDSQHFHMPARIQSISLLVCIQSVTVSHPASYFMSQACNHPVCKLCISLIYEVHKSFIAFNSMASKDSLKKTRKMPILCYRNWMWYINQCVNGHVGCKLPITKSY